MSQMYISQTFNINYFDALSQASQGISLFPNLNQDVENKQIAVHSSWLISELYNHKFE